MQLTIACTALALFVVKSARGKQLQRALCRNPARPSPKPVNPFVSPTQVDSNGSKPCESDFRGNLDETFRGTACLRWDDEALTNQLGLDLLEEYPDSGLEDGNYCRNPDNDPNGPWCFTSVEGDGDYCSPACSPCGFGHRGSVSQTSTGATCLSWDDEELTNRGTDLLTEFPNSGLEDGNFCRNPDNDPNGPWCITSIEGYGDFDYCDTGCSTCGSSFRGNQDMTALGSACLRWDDEALKNQLGHDLLEYFPDSGLEDGNFCRNPNNDPAGPWCFTSVEGEFDYCDVPKCGVSKPAATRRRSLFPSAISNGFSKFKGRVGSAPIIDLCTSSTANEAGFISGTVGAVATLLICTVLLAH